MVERFHRVLKEKLMARSVSAGSDWVMHLPFVLLGIRSTIRADAGVSPADLLYGSPLRLPGEFVLPPTGDQDFVPSSAFVQDLQQRIRALAPMPVEHHRRPTSHVPRELSLAKFVFVRIDAVKKPLVRPYEGPFPVKEAGEKTFVLDRNGVDWKVSVDRLKIAYLPEQKETVLSPDFNAETKNKENSPPLVQTRSGRISRPVIPFTAV